jgi:D-threo-aldose 1-dehydrogenase
MAGFGDTGIALPRVVFGTSALGNLYAAHPAETKLSILREALASGAQPVVLDSAGKYGAGLALEVIGRGLRTLHADPEAVLISNKLGWRRKPLCGPEPTFEPGAWVGIEHDAVQDIGYAGILRCWEQGCELLGAPYRPRLVSVHDPDEYLSGGGDRSQVLDAYRALFELKAAGKVRGVGVGAKDFRVVRWLADEVPLDWVMLACSLTVLTHPEEVVDFVASLERRGVGVINSAVFHAGFLVGGRFFDYRELEAGHSLFAWRARFLDLCREHDVSPAAACVEFGLSPPGVASVALNASRPEQVRQNLLLAQAAAPRAFWLAMKDQGLVRRDYPYLG